MNKTAEVGEKVYKYNQPPQQKGLIDNALPREIISMIFSYLNPKDIQSASVVNRHWNDLSIYTAKHKQSCRIKAFAKFLGENLPEVPKREQLFSIAKDNQILDAENLKQIKSSIYTTRKRFVELLKDLDIEYLNNLEKSPEYIIKPIFFENIFDLATSAKINQIDQTFDDDQKAFTLWTISEKLTESKHMKNAIAAANMIPDTFVKTPILIEISMALKQSGNFEKAIEVANMMPDDRY